MDNVLTTDQKGAIAEMKIAVRAAELGVGVWTSSTVERYDLIFDLRPGLVRVQCKWAARTGDVALIRCCRHRRNRDGVLRQFYSAEDVDAFAAYCAEMDECYFLPMDLIAGRTHILLRFAPTRNNQAAGIHWAKDFEFAARIGSQGAVAQLGERRAGSA